MPDDVNVLKEALCPSLSAQSTITYQIGNTPDGTIHLRLTGNSGQGNFNGFWVPLPDILAVLNDQDEPFIWSALCLLYEGRSVNSACFLAAALKNEGLIKQSKEQPRRYELADPEEFMAKVQALMSPKPAKPKKGGKKPPPAVDQPADFEESTQATA